MKGQCNAYASPPMPCIRLPLLELEENRIQKEEVTFLQYRMATAYDPPGYPGTRTLILRT